MAPQAAVLNALNDEDSLETQEWLDALAAVLDREGPERAHFLIEQLLEEARQHSIDMPFSANTGYVNTSEPNQEARCPGNIEIEGHYLKNRNFVGNFTQLIASVTRAHSGGLQRVWSFRDSP